MGNLEDSIEILKAERAVNAKVANSPGEEKTPEELKRDLIEKKILENREIMEALKAKKAKEALKSEFVEHETKPMTEYKVEPVSNPNIECPFCGEEKRPKGMARHIVAIHEIEGVTIQDLDDVEKGLKSLKDLVTEKHKGKGDPAVYGLSDDVKKREFADWTDIEPEENLEEGPEDKKIIENPGPPGSPACYENPGEKNPGQGNFVERRKFNLIPFYFPFQRRNYRK